MAGIEVAKMYGTLSLDDKPYHRGMEKAHKDTQTFVGKITGTFTSMKGLFAVALGSAVVGSTVAFFSKAISASASLQDTLSRTRAILKDHASEVEDEAQRMADTLGVVKTEYLAAASSFAAMFKGAGFGLDEAAKNANMLTKLGMDLASFANTTNEEAFTALQAVFRGEFDPAERFNIFISAAKVETEALALGLVKTKKEIDDNVKRQATLSLVLKQTADAQGDLTNTIDQHNNAVKRLGGVWENFMAELGTALEPAVGALIPELTKATVEFIDFARGHQDDIKELAKVIGTDLVGALQAVLALVEQNKKNFEAMIGVWDSAPQWMKDAIGGTLSALASPFSPGIPPTPEGLDAASAAATKKALADEKARGLPGKTLGLGAPGIFGGMPAVPGVSNPFFDRIRDLEMQRRSAQAIAGQLAPGIPGMQGWQLGMESSLLRPEGAQTDEEKLQALEQQRSLIAGLIPEVVQRTSQLFTEGGSMEQQFQQRILEQTNKQDEANKTLKSIDEGIAEMKEALLKKALDQYAKIAPAAAAR